MGKKGTREMTDEELKQYEITVHSSNKENINYMKEFCKNMVERHKRQLEFSKELMKEAFKNDFK
jgi:hypothetical protein